MIFKTNNRYIKKEYGYYFSPGTPKRKCYALKKLLGGTKRQLICLENRATDTYMGDNITGYLKTFELDGKKVIVISKKSKSDDFIFVDHSRICKVCVRSSGHILYQADDYIEETLCDKCDLYNGVMCTSTNGCTLEHIIERSVTIKTNKSKQVDSSNQ